VGSCCKEAITDKCLRASILRIDFEDALFGAEQNPFGYRLCQFVDLVDNASKGPPLNTDVRQQGLKNDLP
jgi:hypothetical protein